MAVAVPARNEKHPRRRNPGNEKGIMVSAAHHFEKWKSMLPAGTGKRLTHFGSAIRRRISVDQFPPNRDLTLRGNALSSALDHLHHALAPRQVRIPNVECHAQPTRKA